VADDAAAMADDAGLVDDDTALHLLTSTYAAHTATAFVGSRERSHSTQLTERRSPQSHPSHYNTIRPTQRVSSREIQLPYTNLQVAVTDLQAYQVVV